VTCRRELVRLGLADRVSAPSDSYHVAHDASDERAILATATLAESSYCQRIAWQGWAPPRRASYAPSSSQSVTDHEACMISLTALDFHTPLRQGAPQ
jgi:hypothetical protein